MCQAHIKLWFWFGLIWPGLGWPWFGLVLFGMCVKLNYQVSLLTLDGWVGVGEIETKAKAWAELGNIKTKIIITKIHKSMVHK